MSRIGNQAIEIPSAVTVTINGTDVTVKGPKGELKMTLPPGITAAAEDNKIVTVILSEMHQRITAGGRTAESPIKKCFFYSPHKSK